MPLSYPIHRLTRLLNFSSWNNGYRKRRLRQANRAEEDANAGDSGSFKEEVLVAGNRPQKSRLAGRLGVREQGKRAHSDDNEGIEDRNKLPTLREGKDLRDLLNGDPTAVKDETGKRV